MAEIRLRGDQHADAEDLNRIAVAAFDPLGTTIATGRRRGHGFCEGPWRSADLWRRLPRL